MHDLQTSSVVNAEIAGGVGQRQRGKRARLTGRIGRNHGVTRTVV
jgi:hypothetical protein